MTAILFPSEPFQPRTVDTAFEAEREAARAEGLACHLVDHTRVTTGESRAATASVGPAPHGAIYRGWMLKPDEYQAMYESLGARSVRLINTADQYRACHHLPESYAYLEGRTPKTTWMALEGPPSREQLRELAAPFGSKALVIKDYVKSQKHYWAEACFIPDASDLEHVERVVNRFLELQGDDLNVGLVFREYVPLRVVGEHPKSGMPLAAEFRIFWLDHEPILVHRYWADLVELEAEVPIDELRSMAKAIPSRFFTMDVAMLDDGSWIVVELGDARVSGLPSDAVAPGFYRRLRELLGGTESGSPS